MLPVIFVIACAFAFMLGAELALRLLKQIARSDSIEDFLEMLDHRAAALKAAPGGKNVVPFRR